MDELVRFLRDRLYEDERDATGASPGPWHVNEEGDEVLAVDGITVAEGFALSGRQLAATTAHIARHDPARVLAEIESKRRIAEFNAKAVKVPTSSQGVALAILTLRALARPYAGHPDYRENWLP